MKLINTYILLVCATIAVTLHSCSDSFLQRDSLVAVSSGTFWTSEVDWRLVMTDYRITFCTMEIFIKEEGRWLWIV